MKFITSITLSLSFLLSTLAHADGLRDNNPAAVRPIPPVGNDLEPAEKESLLAGLNDLQSAITDLRQRLHDKPTLLAYLPDIQIFYNAVEYPLSNHETIDVGMARRALAHGMQRAAALREGKTPWEQTSGPRGYVSRIDNSVQPYIINLPSAELDNPHGKRWPMEVWGHGRDELLTELRFVELDDHLHELKYMNQPLDAPDRFRLAIYGRYINAYRFAGEVDGLEALADAKRRYPIDENRLIAIGLSLGGTAAWQYGVHYADHWAAISPAAGLAETREFLKTFQKEDVSNAPWYQQALWHLYDSTDYVTNLAGLPTIAYGGELDPQKQASDIMLQAAAKDGVHLDQIIGRRIGHHYSPEAKAEIDARLNAILAKGRNPFPEQLRFTTWTLKYNAMDWLIVDALEHHWQRARVEAAITRIQGGQHLGFSLTTQNVNRLTLSIPARLSQFTPDQRPTVFIDGQQLDQPPIPADKSFTAHFRRENGVWKNQDAPTSDLRKKHNLQGPIDDAFMEHFIIVRPTGRPFNDQTAKWELAECDHAIEHWFKQFRAHPIVKNDTDITEADIAESNLILFGDPSSNTILSRIAQRLPIQWSADSITLSDRKFPSTSHVPVLVYPNPLHPDHYIVLNSGFTYREYDYLNNARQTPKLPDYAIFDVTTSRTTQLPAAVTAAGFFDEKWAIQPDDGKSQVQLRADPAKADR